MITFDSVNRKTSFDFTYPGCIFENFIRIVRQDCTTADLSQQRVEDFIAFAHVQVSSTGHVVCDAKGDIVSSVPCVCAGGLILIGSHFCGVFYAPSLDSFKLIYDTENPIIDDSVYACMSPTRYYSTQSSIMMGSLPESVVLLKNGAFCSYPAQARPMSMPECSQAFVNSMVPECFFGMKSAGKNLDPIPTGPFGGLSSFLNPDRAVGDDFSYPEEKGIFINPSLKGQLNLFAAGLKVDAQLLSRVYNRPVSATYSSTVTYYLIEVLRFANFDSASELLLLSAQDNFFAGLSFVLRRLLGQSEAECGSSTNTFFVSYDSKLTDICNEYVEVFKREQNRVQLSCRKQINAFGVTVCGFSAPLKEGVAHHFSSFFTSSDKYSKIPGVDKTKLSEVSVTGFPIIQIPAEGQIDTFVPDVQSNFAGICDIFDLDAFYVDKQTGDRIDAPLEEEGRTDLQLVINFRDQHLPGTSVAARLVDAVKSKFETSFGAIENLVGSLNNEVEPALEINNVAVSVSDNDGHYEHEHPCMDDGEASFKNYFTTNEATLPNGSVGYVNFSNFCKFRPKAFINKSHESYVKDTVRTTCDGAELAEIKKAFSDVKEWKVSDDNYIVSYCKKRVVPTLQWHDNATRPDNDSFTLATKSTIDAIHVGKLYAECVEDSTDDTKTYYLRGFTEFNVCLTLAFINAVDEESGESEALKVSAEFAREVMSLVASKINNVNTADVSGDELDALRARGYYDCFANLGGYVSNDHYVTIPASWGGVSCCGHFSRNYNGIVGTKHLQGNTKFVPVRSLSYSVRFCVPFSSLTLSSVFIEKFTSGVTSVKDKIDAIASKVAIAYLLSNLKDFNLGDLHLCGKEKENFLSLSTLQLFSSPSVRGESANALKLAFEAVLDARDQVTGDFVYQSGSPERNRLLKICSELEQLEKPIARAFWYMEDPSGLTYSIDPASIADNLEVS